MESPLLRFLERLINAVRPKRPSKPSRQPWVPTPPEQRAPRNNTDEVVGSRASAALWPVNVKFVGEERPRQGTVVRLEFDGGREPLKGVVNAEGVAQIDIPISVAKDPKANFKISIGETVIREGARLAGATLVIQNVPSNLSSGRQTG